MKEVNKYVLSGSAKIEVSNIDARHGCGWCTPSLCFYYFNPKQHKGLYRFGIALGFLNWKVGLVFYRNWV